MVSVILLTISVLCANIAAIIISVRLSKLLELIEEEHTETYLKIEKLEKRIINQEIMLNILLK